MLYHALAPLFDAVLDNVLRWPAHCSAMAAQVAQENFGKNSILGASAVEKCVKAVHCGRFREMKGDVQRVG